MDPLTIGLLLALGVGVDYVTDFSGLHLDKSKDPKNKDAKAPAANASTQQVNYRTGGVPDYTQQNVRPPPMVQTAPAVPPNAPTPLVPIILASTTQQPLDPTSVQANELANMVQPQPKDQPPLPPVTTSAAMTAGTTAVVSTQGSAGTDNAALRVRSQPSTTAPVVPGGEPSQGGGFDKGATVNITGPVTAGFAPVAGMNRKGQNITGWAWAGYMTPTGGGVFAGESTKPGSSMGVEIGIG